MAILDLLEDWLRSMANKSFEEFFSTIISIISGVTDELSVTPDNTGAMFGDPALIWNYITQISEHAIMPIAGVLLGYTLAKEILDEIIEKNTFSQVNTTNIIKIFAKLIFSFLLTVNALKITSAIFALGGVILNRIPNVLDENLDVVNITTQMSTLIDSAEIPDLMNIIFSLQIAKLLAHVIKIGVILIVYGRVIQMIMYTTFAPLPFATFGNKDFDLSQNYIKNIAALALQAFLLLFVLGLYGILLRAQLSGLTINDIGQLAGKIYGICGFGILLIVSLGKTLNVTKSIMGAH